MTKRVLNGSVLFFICFFIILPLLASGETYTVIEGRGIQGIAEIGYDMIDVQKIWGEADQAKKDEWSTLSHVVYGYHKRGVLFSTDRFGKITGIVLYCNTRNKDQFYNPGGVFQTFQGKTIQGLEFKDRLTPEDVYEVYGKPVVIISGTSSSHENYDPGKSMIITVINGEYIIRYPTGISFRVVGGLVETCEIESN